MIVPQECPTESCKSVPQECPTRVSQECPTRVSDESVGRVSHKSVPQECPTQVFNKRSHKNAIQECRKRVTHKSVLQECSARKSHKNVPEECSTRVPYKSIPQECSTRVSDKNVPQDCSIRESDKTPTSYKSVARRCPTRVSRVLQDFAQRLDMNSSRDALTFARTSDINIKHPLKFNIEILEPCLRGRGSRSTSTDACTLFTPNRHFVFPANLQKLSQLASSHPKLRKSKKIRRLNTLGRLTADVHHKHCNKQTCTKRARPQSDC